jgi:transketolase
MVDVAAGMALDGRQVFCYAMAPFATLRCLEQHKCASGVMNLPVCTIVSGIGLGYADAGPTHYATEDLACLRAIINSHVLTASDGETARLLAADVLDRPRFSFVRLDRQASADLSPIARIADVRRGYRIMREGRRLAVVSHGFTLARALETVDGGDLHDVAVVDLIQAKPIPEGLVSYLSQFQAVLTIEEQTPCGGLAAAVLEAMADAGTLLKPFHRLTLPERYFFENGGRTKLLELAALSQSDIAAKITSILAMP